MSIFDTISVLVIEDDPQIVELIKEILTNNTPSHWPLTYKIKSVSTLKAAQRYVSGGAWDVILLDLGLPDSQGLNTFQAVFEKAKAPIVVITGSIDYELIGQMHGLGAARCYEKMDIRPACSKFIHKMIDNVLREWRKNRRLENLQAAMFDELRNLINECAHCHLWRDPVSEQYISPLKFLEKYDIFLTSGVCPTCRDKIYGHLMNEKTD